MPKTNTTVMNTAMPQVFRAQITVKGAKDEEATKARLRADALLARCVIKPVMTDEEIALCVAAYKQTRN